MFFLSLSTKNLFLSLSVGASLLKLINMDKNGQTHNGNNACDRRREREEWRKRRKGDANIYLVTQRTRTFFSRIQRKCVS